MLTISKLKRWSINYYIDTAKAAEYGAKDLARARLCRSEGLASDASDWMDSLTWYDAPREQDHSNFYATVNSRAKRVYCSVHNPATEGRI
jgi:hypothetical protein